MAWSDKRGDLISSFSTFNFQINKPINQKDMVQYNNIAAWCGSNKDGVKNVISVAVEATGDDTFKDDILSIALAKYDAETMECVETLSTNVHTDKDISIRTWMRSGMTLKDTENAPHFIDIADQVIAFFGNVKESVIVGYNVRNFALPFIYNACAKVGKTIDFTNYMGDGCIVLDALDFMDGEGVYYPDFFTAYYKVCGNEANDKALSALPDNALNLIESYFMNGVKPITKHVFDNSNFVAYRVFRNTIFVNRFSNDSEIYTKTLVFTRGKYYNCPVKKVAQVDKSYIAWVLSEVSTLSKATKDKLREYLGV